MAVKPPARSLRPLGPRRRAPWRSTDHSRDASTFEAVYLGCRQDLARYVASIVRDADAVEDVLQTTMLKALTALREEKRDFELRPWLFRIAHNVAVDRLRTQRPTVEIDERWASPGPAVPEQAESRDALETLWQDLSGLPERQRQALVLRELSGLGHDEIGGILGSSGRAVKQTIFEARRALHDCAQGRDTACDDIQQALSDGDGRVRRGRGMRAHLSACADCRTFALALADRPERLRLLTPILPLAGLSTSITKLLPGGADATAAGSATGAAAMTTAVGGASAVGGTGAATTAAATTGGLATVATGVPSIGTGAVGWLGAAVATKAAAITVLSATVVAGSGAAAIATRAPSERPVRTVDAALPVSATPNGSPAIAGVIGGPSSRNQATTSATPDAGKSTKPAATAEPRAAASRARGDGDDRRATATASTGPAASASAGAGDAARGSGRSSSEAKKLTAGEAKRSDASAKSQDGRGTSSTTSDRPAASAKPDRGAASADTAGRRPDPSADSGGSQSRGGGATEAAGNSSAGGSGAAASDTSANGSSAVAPSKSRGAADAGAGAGGAARGAVSD